MAHIQGASLATITPDSDAKTATVDAAGNNCAVETEGLCRRYGRRWALANVDLRVSVGSVVMITGRNGSGKSTLLRVLSTAIRADRGTARIFGLALWAERDEVRRRIALLTHKSHLYEALSAWENLEIAARFLQTEHAAERIGSLLAEVGLASRALDPVGTYSAGMRKRLALARTLLQDAPLVLLDEPYAALDVHGFDFVDSVITRLRNEGTTVLVATHLLEHGHALYDAAILLEDGQLVWSGRPADVPLRAAGAGRTVGGVV